MVSPDNIIPKNTAIDELMLCFTTSVSFSAFIFGYFRLINIPIVSDTSGNTIDAISIIIISKILKLNLINTIISPINMNGIIIITAVITLESRIVNGFTGKLFKILKDFPSNDIMELVIDDINDVKHTNPNSITAINDLS